MTDYARGRADALREAAALIKKIMNKAEIKILDRLDARSIGRALAEQIEALAQQPEPKRECGTCKHDRNGLGDMRCFDCSRASSRLNDYGCTDNWQPKAGA